MRTVSLVAILGLILLARPAAAAVRWDVVSSDADALVLEVTIPEGTLRTVVVGEESYARVEIPGLGPGGEPGQPELPTTGRWFLVPPGATPRVEVEVLETQPLGAARLVPIPTPRRIPGVGDAPRLSEEIQEGPGYASVSRGEGDLVRIGSAVWQRRQRMAPLTLDPVLYSPGGRVDLARRLRITLRFGGGDPVEPAPGEPDRLVLRSVLNPEWATTWRADSPEHRRLRRIWETAQDPGKRTDGVVPFDPDALLSGEIRVRTNDTGLWRVRVSDLVDNHGFPLDQPRRNLRLYEKRASPVDDPAYPLPLTADVPFTFLGNPDPDANLASSDVLVFHGYHPRDQLGPKTVDGGTLPATMPERADNWNSTQVYFLAFADPGEGNGWKRIPRVTPAASTGNPQPSFRWTETFEADGDYQDNPRNSSEPRYHINEAFSREATTALEIRHPAPGSDLTVTWSTVSRVTTGTRNMIFQLDKQGARTDLATLNVGSPFYGVLRDNTRVVSADDIGHGFVDFRMVREGDLNLGVYIGRVDVEYDALFLSDFDQAFVASGQVGGTVDVEIDGFGREDLLVFDVTDPDAIRQLDPLTVSDGNGGFRLAMRVQQDDGVEHRFTVLPATRIQLARGAALESDPVPLAIDPQGTHGALAPSQVIALGPAFFSATMEPWLQWRRDRDRDGWTYNFVDIQEVYDQFSGGLKSPTAIKRAAEYAYVMWGATALVLVGDACEDARALGRRPGFDHVPTSLHLQNTFSQEFELLASDKWFGIFGTDALYPASLNKGPDMLVGRFPANDEAQLQVMLDKVFEYETPSADDDWRRRSLWMADDAYSTNYLGGSASPCYQYWGIEEAFAQSQAQSADHINTCFDGTFEAQTWILEDFTEQYRADCGLDLCDCNAFVIGEASFEAVPNLVNKLSEGWLIVSYQGHANYSRLGHETLLTRENIPQINNAGKYFLWFGMGCHVTDFLQAEEGGANAEPGLGPPIGEVMLEAAGRGAIATYGSSGFEFLTPNKIFMELIADNFFCRSRSESPVFGSGLVGQWILGEQLAQSELDVLSTNASAREEMMAQYNLLGDPLLRMDAAPPRVSITADGNAIADGAELLPAVGSDRVALALDLTDEAGVAEVRVTDSEGRDYSGAVQFTGPDDDPRQRAATLDLPIQPQGYTLTVDAFDAAYPGERPTSASFTVPFQLTVLVDNEEVQPGSGAIPEGAQLRVDFTSPVALVEGDIALSLSGATLSAVSVQSQDTDGRAWSLQTGVVDVVAGEAQALDLALKGVSTEFDFQEGGGPGDALAITAHYPFPNPATGPVRFIVDSTARLAWARLSVYSLSGRRLHQGEQDLGDNTGRVVFEWDGLDNRGDELANGVYLYRIEVGGDAGSVQTDMGRVVFMR